MGQATETSSRDAREDQRDLLNSVLCPDDFRTILDESRSELDRDKIQRALVLASEAHQGQNRRSGDPYISHPLGVAALLIREDMDTDSICAALLHDVIEDTDVGKERLVEEFGADVANLVDGVTKIGKLKFESKATEQAENMRKMMLAMTSDLRVILIKLADRLHNMATLGHMPVEKRQRIARETLEIYAPLARRLGISKIQWALEDICLRHMNPNVYFDLVRRVAQKRQAREHFVEQLQCEVAAVLGEAGIVGVIKGRPKSFFSIYKKTLERDRNLNDIYDLIGLRVLVDDVKDCYAALGIIHKTWKPLQKRFKDYIAVPKSNLYQSLHTTVIHPEGHVFEVQIRTHEMDEVAELGVAAHWAYKEGLSAQETARRKLTWLKQIVGWHEDSKDSGQFLENVKVDLFQDQVYVFTPKGKVIEMAAGATGLDFAYHIHTEVGHQCVGVIVDGKMVPMDTPLKNTQVVSVRTSKNSEGPSRHWLDMVRTNRARNKIRTFLRRQNRDEFLVKGKEMLLGDIDKHVKALGKDTDLTVQQVLKHEDFLEALDRSGYKDLEEAAVAIGRGDCNPKQILYKVDCLRPPETPVTTEDIVAKQRPMKTTPQGGVLVGGQGDMLVRLSKCCSPVIGDEIVGYITRGRGVSIHRTDCPNVADLEGEENRRVDVGWDERVAQDKTATYLADVEVITNDQPNVLSRVTNVIAGFKVNIRTAAARTTRTQTGVLNYGLEIRDALQLKNLLQAIAALPEVIEVYRMKPGIRPGDGQDGGSRAKRRQGAPGKGKTRKKHRN